MRKRVATGNLDFYGPAVKEIYSVSGCISEDFADYVEFCRYNGYWFFDAPRIIEELAEEHHIDLFAMTLFYYDVYEEEFDEHSRRWTPLVPDEAFSTNVVVPREKKIKGFDVVTFSVKTMPECSPLSCNGLAKEVSVNKHCLFNTFEEAKHALEKGLFDNSEPGPFRIFAVYVPCAGGVNLVSG